MEMGIFKVLGGWILLTACAWAGGPFAAPAEGPVPFRRDRLPLDVETMTELSKALVLHAGFFDTSTAEGRRAVVQALALAVALDPLYRPTREILERLPETGEVPKPKGEKPDLAFFVEIENWLGNEAAGWEAQGLASCLRDIRGMLDPEYGSSRNGVSSSAWKGWVPEVTAFETPKDSLTPTAEGSDLAFAKEEAKILTPLWILRTDPGVMSVAPVKMRSAIYKPGFSGERSPFAVVYKGRKSATVQRVLQEVTKAVEELGTSLPLGGRMDLFPERYTEEPDLAAISGAIAVLMDAVVSRREPEGIVVGRVAADGAFRVPQRAWERLRRIPQGSQEIQRLVVPRDAVPLLKGLLVLQGPDFFSDYEVVVADSLKDLVERSDKGAVGAFGEASARFRQLMMQKGETPTDRFISRPAVRRVLVEISQICPDLVSAAFLELHASGKKPTTVPGVVLGGEMLMAFEPLDALLSSPARTTSDAALEHVLEQCRSAVTPLAQKVEVKDRDLYARALELLNDLRALPRARRNASSFKRAFKALKTQYNQFHHDAAELAGEDPTMRWGWPAPSTREQE